MLEDLAVRVLSLALPAAGTVAIIRALPWPAAWKARKPLGCGLCLSWWSALAVLLAYHCAGLVPIVWTFAGVIGRGADLLAATALCLWFALQVVTDLSGGGDALAALLAHEPGRVGEGDLQLREGDDRQGEGH